MAGYHALPILRKAHHIRLFQIIEDRMKVLRGAQVTHQSEYEDPSAVQILHHICASFAARRIV
jgi:hypothetical protein